MIDNEDIDWARLRLQFEPELILQSVDESRTVRVWLEARPCRNVRRKLHCEIYLSSQPCFIQDRAIYATHPGKAQNTDNDIHRNVSSAGTNAAGCVP